MFLLHDIQLLHRNGVNIGITVLRFGFFELSGVAFAYLGKIAVRSGGGKRLQGLHSGDIDADKCVEILAVSAGDEGRISQAYFERG